MVVVHRRTKGLRAVTSGSGLPSGMAYLFISLTIQLSQGQNALCAPLASHQDKYSYGQPI